MKKWNEILLVLTVLGTFASLSFSQSKEVTENDINDLRDKATQMLKSVAYREETTTQEFNDKNSPATQTYIGIREFVPPDRHHFIWKSENAKGVSESESIYISGTRYDKDQNGVWKRAAPVGSGMGSGIGSGRGTQVVPRVKVRIAYRPNEMRGNTRTQFYEIKKRSTFTLNDGEVERFSISRYWFNQNGTLARTEYESSSSNSKALRRITSVYEYDPNIKIEVPKQ